VDFGASRRLAPSPMLTPLIDVVFLLLIFFLLASAFVPPDLFQVRPPISKEGESQQAPNVTVLVHGDGVVAVNNRVISADGLVLALRAELQGRPDRSMTIKADASTPSGFILDVLLAAQNADVGNVRLITVRE
jgi:biopolymer transport protein ExbD